MPQKVWDAIHWSRVGDPHATDHTIMAWANENGYVVFTHDLDFGALLAATQATSPSVIQVRAQNILPGDIGEVVALAITTLQPELSQGALITIEPERARARVLPLAR